MSDGDIFREVQEEMRRERLARAWDRYGLYVLAVAGLIVIGVAGTRFWQHRQAGEAARLGDAFTAAQALVESDKAAEAATAFQGLGRDGTPGYRLIALLSRAGLAAKEGRSADAVALYDEATALRDPNALLTGFARIQSAALLVDSAPESEIIRRVGSLAVPGDPWRNAARELLGLAAYKAGRQGEAEKQFRAVFGDPVAPPALRQRTEQMLALLVRGKAPDGTAATGTQ